ncbi:ribosomal-processing cysteine protease Prp [Selenomonas sp. TAMA-11512]|uniref:ribosomal-processing cysteine protease Prp n=1 Tax=Selenomonas sp. TAMA-11512 TaxID=3095337 RepID=UPI003084C8CB|nr:ribosomal-processing cysteine protease Prp [Selenomonas sp. TAMA-11512]
MIEVCLYRQNGRITGYDVTGHSGTADHGFDIVCAGISSLAQTALLGLGMHLHRKVDYHVASGDLHVELLEAPDEKTDAILETMLLGIREIVKLRPEAVRLLENESGR